VFLRNMFQSGDNIKIDLRQRSCGKLTRLVLGSCTVASYIISCDEPSGCALRAFHSSDLIINASKRDTSETLKGLANRPLNETSSSFMMFQRIFGDVSVVCRPGKGKLNHVVTHFHQTVADKANSSKAVLIRLQK
jgi:hypothetical protein